MKNTGEPRDLENDRLGRRDGMDIPPDIRAKVATILATSVFERMCVSDPRMRSRLRPCGRRLVSADSSPLTVHGELNMTVVFPGLSCDMIPVVASIGLDGLLGTKIMQHCEHTHAKPNISYPMVM